MNLCLASGAPGPGADPASEHLCFDWAALETRRAKGWAARPWESFVDPERAADLDLAARAMAESWHEHDGDLTSFEGVSLGQSYRWLLWVGHIQPVLKSVAALDGAVSSRRPARVSCESGIPDFHRSLLALVERGRGGFQVDWALGGGPERESFSWTPPRLTLPRGRRAALRAFNALSSPFRRRRGRRVLMSYYPSFDGLLERAASEPGFQFDLADAPNRRHWAALMRSGARVWSEPRTPARWSAGQRAALAEIRRRWAAAKAAPAFRERFSWAGIPLFEALQPAFDRFFDELLEPLAWMAHQLQEVWRREKPDLLLLPMDTPPYQNLLAATARLHKTPSLVALHGLPSDYSYPFEHTFCDHFAVWGPEQKTLYERAGALGGKTVLACGHPLIDAYRRAPRRDITSLSRVLVLSNPVDRSEWLSSSLDVERYALEVPAAAARVAGRVVFKLHPSESERYYRELLGPAPGFQVERRAPVAGLLKEADLVVGPLSTVLLEAAAAGVPVVCVNYGRRDYPPPLDGRWGIPVARDAGQLAELLGRVASGPAAYAREAARKQDAVLEAFAGTSGGPAAGRLLRELERIAL